MTVPPGSAEPAVRVVDVFVAFLGGAGPVMALRGAELTVAAGERLVIEGPNGSGKTTLLRAITGEQPVTAGHVEVAGTPLEKMTSEQRRRWRATSVGFVDQHARRALLPELSILDNVALQLGLLERSVKEAHSAAAETLDRLDLRQLSTRSVAELSGGEAQQVAICAAVAHRPRLVLADEPTGELDDAAAGEVYEMLSRVADDGTSLIMVCHDRRADAFADRGVSIRDGRVAAQWRGTRSNLTPVPDSRGWLRPAEAPVPVRPAETIAPTVRRARSEPAVELSGVAVGYPGHTVASDLELSVDAGGWIAVRGPSGSGKTTLLSTIVGLLDPLAGQLTIMGTPLGSLDRTARADLRRRALAVAPQRPALLESSTVIENLAVLASVRGRALAPADVDRLLDDLRMTELRLQPAAALSGGERQRLAAAIALAGDAPVLVLDEPTSQQDEESADALVGVLRAAWGAGRTVIVASHDDRCLSPAHRVISLRPRE